MGSKPMNPCKLPTSNINHLDVLAVVYKRKSVQLTPPLSLMPFLCHQHMRWNNIFGQWPLLRAESGWICWLAYNMNAICLDWAKRNNFSSCAESLPCYERRWSRSAAALQQKSDSNIGNGQAPPCVNEYTCVCLVWLLNMFCVGFAFVYSPMTLPQNGLTLKCSKCGVVSASALSTSTASNAMFVTLHLCHFCFLSFCILRFYQLHAFNFVFLYVYVCKREMLFSIVLSSFLESRVCNPDKSQVHHINIGQHIILAPS